MLTNEEKLKELRNLLVLNPDDPVDDYLTPGDMIDFIDELLAIRSMRDAGDEEVEDLAGEASNGIGLDWYWNRADCGKSSDCLEKLKLIAIARGQQLREAREEIERLNGEIATLKPKWPLHTDCVTIDSNGANNP